VADKSQKEKIEPFIDALMLAGNLEINQTKTLVYYCIMTWSDESIIRPIINLNGESGTGKNSIMKQMELLCCEPKWINARGITTAQLRDELADTVTAIVEEADKTDDQKKSENWYQNRYEETGRNKRYRRQTTNARGTSIYKEETHNHFGYTVLHTQNPFQSMEMDRRVLTITLYKSSSRKYQLTEGLDQTPLSLVAAEVDWNKDIESELSNSAWDVWLPLMRIADYLGDTGFIEYAREQIQLKTKADDETMVFEPKGVVLSEVAELYKLAAREGKGRIAITEVR